MENRDNQPAAERPLPDEPVPQIMRSDDNNNGAMAQPHELSVKEKADRFIGKALSSLEELKTECGEDEEKKRIHNCFGMCLKEYYTVQEIEARMLATHDVSAEKVGVLYKELVERSGGNAKGGEAYEEYARLTRENELSVKEKAENFILKLLWLLVDLKNQCGEDEVKKEFCDSVGVCVQSCYTIQEIEAHMLAVHGTPAEAVGQFYNAIVVRTGDTSGGEAYEKHSMDCARLRREMEAREADEERRRNGHGVSVSGRRKGPRSSK